MRALACARHDVRLQLRYGFYTAYAVVTVIYVALLRLLPEAARELLCPVVLFTDPAVMGYFFVGALLMFERGDGTLEALWVTPLRVAEYMASKALSLTVLALLTTSVIAVATVGFSIHWPLLITGVALTSIPFALLGIGLAARFERLTGYLVIAGLAQTPFYFPLLDHFGLVRSWVLYLIPSQASLLLIGGGLGTRTLATWEILYAISMLLVCTLLAYLWAFRIFNNHVVGRGAAT